MYGFGVLYERYLPVDTVNSEVKINSFWAEKNVAVGEKIEEMRLPGHNYRVCPYIKGKASEA